MSVNQTFNGVTYPIPTQGDLNWAAPLDRYLIALGTYALSPAGGSFTLTSNVNFGPTFGLLSPYFTSTSSNPASSGILRLSNTDLVEWRNFANSGNNTLGVNSSNQLTYNGVAIQPVSLTNAHIFVGNGSNLSADVAVSGDISLANTGAMSVNNVQNGVITNTMVNSSAAIAYSKLNLSGSIVNADIFSAAAIARSKIASGTANSLVVNDGSGNLSSFLNNGTNGQALLSNGSGGLSWGSFSGTPGGSNQQVQFNDSGSFGGNTNFSYDKTANILSLIQPTMTDPGTEGVCLDLNGAITFETTEAGPNYSTSGTAIGGLSYRHSGHNFANHVFAFRASQATGDSGFGGGYIFEGAGGGGLLGYVIIDHNGNLAVVASSTALATYVPANKLEVLGSAAIGLSYASTAAPTNGLIVQGQVGIGQTGPDASAILDISTTSKGVVFPRMTTTQKNAIASPTEGLMVYDLTLHAPYFYNGSSWVAF